MFEINRKQQYAKTIYEVAIDKTTLLWLYENHLLHHLLLQHPDRGDGVYSLTASELGILRLFANLALNTDKLSKAIMRKLVPALKLEQL